MSDPLYSKDTPSLTVVIPSFNQAGTIEKTLTSILDHNDLRGLEVLVFDSMSTDGTSEILEKWKNRCTIICEKDKGQSDAIHKGFLRAKGDIVCWLNSDDLFFPHALDRVRRLFAENPSAQVISGRSVHLYLDGSFKNLFPEGPNFDEPSLSKFKITVLQSSVFFRRNFLEKLGGINPKLHYVMDWDLWCRFIKAKAHWLTVDDFFSAARVYAATKTSSGGLPRLCEHWRMARKHTGSWFPQATLGLILSWGLEDAPQPISSLFKYAYNVRSLCRFGEIRPNIHNPQFCQGQTSIAFPWYEGTARSIHIDFEFPKPDEQPDFMVIHVNNQPFKKKIQGTSKLQTVIIEGPWSDNSFFISVSTNPVVQFRVLKIMPCT